MFEEGLVKFSGHLLTWLKFRRLEDILVRTEVDTQARKHISQFTTWMHDIL